MTKKAKDIALHDKDTGSSEVQIALLSRNFSHATCFGVGG